MHEGGGGNGVHRGGGGRLVSCLNGLTSPLGHGERRRYRDRVRERDSTREAAMSLGQSTVNAFWAIRLGFHFLPLFSSFLFFFSFLMLTATKNICINVFIIVNY
jgi:hypothetical protein